MSKSINTVSIAVLLLVASNLSADSRRDYLIIEPDPAVD